MKVREVDVVILGLGTSGEDLALQLLDEGLDVVGVEPNLVGGECPYWACIPSKIAVRAANVLAEAGRVNQLAGTATANPDWSVVATRIRNEATGNWDDSYAAQRFMDRGGHLVREYGRLVEPDTVDAGQETFRARMGVVIATGSKPFVPPIPGLDQVAYWTTHDAIQAESLPDSMTIIGGGPVGCELAQVFARFGVKVTVVEGHRLLSNEEPEASDLITDRFETEGIEVKLGAHVTKARTDGDGAMLTLDDNTELAASRVLVATGRATDLSQLGLETLGVDSSSRFVETDDRLRVAEGVWAMGDIAGKAMFTHVALYQGEIIAEDILGKNPEPADYQTLPRVTFTDPEVASVGLTENQARNNGLDIAVALKDLRSTFRGWLHGSGNEGLVKLVVDRSCDILVGATVVGPSAGEVLGLLSVAMHEQIPVANIRRMIFPFPTFYGAIGEAIGAYGRGTGTVLDPEYRNNAILE